MLSVEQHDTVAVIKLNRGTTNALSLELVQALSTAIARAERDPKVRGLVFASANTKFFSIGFDIPALFALSRPQFQQFYSAFNAFCLQLVSLPKPTVAALGGHAIAGGCVLALCCDYRMIAEGRKLIGLNEVKLGVPVPYVADCILRQVVGARAAREIEDLGEFYPPQEALAIGLVDQVLPAEDLLPRAIERSRTIGAMPPDGFAMIKRNRVETIEEQVATRLEGREEYFLDCWYAEGTRARLQEAMKTF